MTAVSLDTISDNAAVHLRLEPTFSRLMRQSFHNHDDAMVEGGVIYLEERMQLEERKRPPDIVKTRT